MDGCQSEMARPLPGSTPFLLQVLLLEPPALPLAWLPAF